MAASDVASCPSVRRALVALQQKIAAGCDVVMDGRDIGTRVLPDADYKFFLTASDKVRAQRRYDELKAKGESVTLQEVLEDVRRRDEQDTTRAESPLTIADDATEVETDDLGIDEVVAIGAKAEKIADGAAQSGGSVTHFATKEEAVHELTDQLGTDTAMLVKASHAMHFGWIVEQLKQAYD